MSDVPDLPGEDPFEGLPPELRAMFEQLGGSQLFAQIRSLLTGEVTGPVNWELARSAALQAVADGDRSPTPAEQQREEHALQLAEHWLDASTLPPSPDAGRLHVASRQEWVNAALTSMRPMIEPVAAAATRAMAELAQEQLGEADLDELGLGPLLGQLGGMDITSLLRPMGAILLGLQTGQVIGELGRQLLGQYDLGLATAPRATAYVLAVNVVEGFADWELDETEVAVALALHQGALRRLYHAVPWLEAHLHALIAQFANGTRIDPGQLDQLTHELFADVDPEDPASMQAAMDRARGFRLEPTAEQRRVLERLQGVLALVQAWADREVERAARERLPNLPRIEEVLRRRRGRRGAGEELLAQLLGLDLRHDDETIGERFVDAVEAARGADGLRRALAHPENLPDTTELADPSAWLVRMAAGEAIPDDPSSLFVGDAPVEPAADDRRSDTDHPQDPNGPPGRDEGHEEGDPTDE